MEMVKLTMKVGHTIIFSFFLEYRKFNEEDEMFVITL